MACGRVFKHNSTAAYYYRPLFAQTLSRITTSSGSLIDGVVTAVSQCTTGIGIPDKYAVTATSRKHSQSCSNASKSFIASFTVTITLVCPCGTAYQDVGLAGRVTSRMALYQKVDNESDSRSLHLNDKIVGGCRSMEDMAKAWNLKTAAHGKGLNGDGFEMRFSISTEVDGIDK
ncbi:hypothetical protein C8T65DRAFT_702007 [Cerioporus squamosus]|nr:hypothetical protein C8T65DRAFT_702007 [Cerioporus squamosus]